jgi:hypothetical protein
VKYTSKDLPGKFQIDRGHFTIWDWSETRPVSTDEEWTALISIDRRVKLAFAMSSPFVWNPKKCLRCRKPGINRGFSGKFKTW